MTFDGSGTSVGLSDTTASTSPEGPNATPADCTQVPNNTWAPRESYCVSVPPVAVPIPTAVRKRQIDGSTNQLFIETPFCLKAIGLPRTVEYIPTTILLAPRVAFFLRAPPPHVAR